MCNEVCLDIALFTTWLKAKYMVCITITLDIKHAASEIENADFKFKQIIAFELLLKNKNFQQQVNFPGFYLKKNVH